VAGWTKMSYADNHGPEEARSMAVHFKPHQIAKAQEFVKYTFGAMARLCATHGWNEPHSRSEERLHLNLTPVSLGYRRGMVVGRQLFFFSQAYRLTAEPIFEARAHCLFEDLANNFWDNNHLGWYFSLRDDKTPHDFTKDLYGHAFIMFGLAHYLSVFKEAKALQWINRANELILRRFSLPGGWFAPATTRNWEILGRNLEQNPHMHLLEAYLSIYRATQDSTFLKHATQIMSIYTELLRTPDGSKVLEHLDDEGQASGEKGSLIEPGHLYEWYWLVNEYADIADLPAYRAASQPIIDWADRWGLDVDAGGIYDLVDREGNVVSNRKRIWPVTERIKASTTLVRAKPSASSVELLMFWINFIMDKYCCEDGSWHEYLKQDLEPDCDYLPLSTPYHVAMAALEVERLLRSPGMPGSEKSRQR
jgi:mannose/cellobiose epimerase-like protein (N-acyl-D-glucosamine 2-epimerase family)